MSTDVYLEINTGGPTPARLTDWRSVSARVVEAWADAGLDLDELDGQQADRAVIKLRETVSAPSIRAAVNPRVRMLLTDWIEDCVLHPLATVRVER